MKQNNLKKVKNLPENTNEKISEIEENISNLQNELNGQKTKLINSQIEMRKLL